MLTVSKNGWGGRRNGSGRKTNAVKSSNFSIRISPAEKQVIESKAKKAGKSLSRFVIDAALNS